MNRLFRIFSIIGFLGIVLYICYYSSNNNEAVAELQDFLNEKDLELFDKANKYVQDGEYDQVLQVVQIVDNPFLKTTILIDLAGKSMEKEKTLKVLSYALQSAKSIEDHFKSFKPELLAKISIKYVEIGEYAHALQVAQTMEDGRDKVRVFAIVFDKYMETKQKDKAIEILSKILETSKSIKNTISKTEALSVVVAKYADIGEYEHALQIANTISENIYSDKSRALAYISGKYVKIEEYDRALQIAQTIESNQIKADEMSKIAIKYAETGQKDKASEILFQALQTACTIKDASVKAMRLYDITKRYEKSGVELDDRARNLLKGDVE